MTERWLPVVGFEGLYEVSDHGRVRSVDRVVPRGSSQFTLRGQLIAQSTMRSGHKRVALSRDAKRHNYLVHRLVLEAFEGECPPNHECCHGLGGPGDNRLQNLRWGTRSENMLDKVLHGGHHNANKTHCKNGHEFTPENTYIEPKGSRNCRMCLRETARAYRQKKKSETSFEV